MNDRSLYLFAFKILGNFGVAIAVPAVLAALAGKWLDTRFNTSPWFLIGLLVLAFVLTAIHVARIAKEYGKEYQRIFESGGKEKGK